MKRIIAAIVMLSFVLFISGCATDANQEQKGTSFMDTVLKNPLWMGLMGFILVGGTTLLLTGDAKKAAIVGVAGGAAGAIIGYSVGRYRDNQTKTAQQVYKENPEYTQPANAAKPPVIKNLSPYIADMKGNPLNAVKGGQEVDLSMKYDIVIPQHSKIEKVEVVEYNTLITPDGKKKMDIEKLTRTQVRNVGGIDAHQAVKLPKGLSAGKYTHVAGVVIGNQKYEQIQTIQVAGIYDANKMYTSNCR